MGMFEMNDQQIAEWRQKCRDLVGPDVNGEEVLAAGGVPPGRGDGELRRVEGTARRRSSTPGSR